MFDEKDIIDLLSTDDEDDSNRTINHRCTQSRLVVPVPVQIKGRELVTQSNNIDDDEEDEDEIKVVHICGNSNNDEHRSPKKKHKKRKRALSLDEGDYRESSPWNYESNLSCTNTSSIERGRIWSTATSSAENNRGKPLIDHCIDLPQFRLYRGDGDNGILWTGFAQLIENLPSTSNNGATRLATYLHSSLIQNKNVIQETKNGRITACRHLAHIQQRDKWTCGFRNLQMLLFALLPNVPEHHPISSFLDTLDTSTSDYNTATSSASNVHNKEVTIPSIQQLQMFMEQAWQEGFDSEGRKHYNGKIVGKKGHEAKVGALEISSILTYLFVDTTVVQFIVCYESRSLLCEFLWAYFNREVSQSSYRTCNLGAEPGSLDFSSKILKHIERKPSPSIMSSLHDAPTGQTTHKNSNTSTIQSCSQRSLLPLYLLWEGHSVTCIGVEKITTNNKKPRQNNHQLKQDEYNVYP